jgi:hypothetical protein
MLEKHEPENLLSMNLVFARGEQLGIFPKNSVNQLSKSMLFGRLILAFGK